ncbi:carbohydrate porin [Flavobacterium sp. NG2]|uniref:carbohydrate porin n=1 Tax=Flavobacterium sp. NG2 TaxID=3097547 RepID=UPI002A810BA5|nr:carbohydrate porin [Flavobacterium sp. NG2]WPR72995.1 carbohydrate porin [Flavobacterium sp. NG2]
MIYKKLKQERGNSPNEKKEKALEKSRKQLKCLLLLFLVVSNLSKLEAQVLFKDDKSTFGTSGYIRSGIGKSEGGETQAHFQMPGALNKYSLGNQADTYGELEFDYMYFLNAEKDKTIDMVWMSTFYEAFGSIKQMEFDKAAQLYVRGKNLLGKGEVIWMGKRYYDRKAIHLLDKQWINPAQNGWGMGVEKLIQKNTNEDLKIGVWTFDDKNVVSFKNGEISRLNNYTLDARWVNKPITPTTNLNLAVNYSYRVKNDVLDYDEKQGFGAFAWLDYEKKSITNTTAILFRQGATISKNHWTGVAERENPDNTATVLNNLNTAYTLEISNNFLYDDLDRFAVNGVLMAIIRDYGTDPYVYNAMSPSQRDYIPGRGNMTYWLTSGARGMYYLNDNFKLSLEFTHEYIKNEQLAVSGNLDKISFTPEISLKKGFYSRPVLRPLITYAFWSNDLKGKIGTTPTGAPFANKTSGFTYGLQFEIWW